MSAVLEKISDRIYTFDLMRGYFLIVILLNHLQFYPSGLDALTGRGILYVSTAEGFFVVSGIVLGLVRGRKLLDQPFRVASKLLLKRSLQLYITAIILTLLFTLLGTLFITNPGIKAGIYTDWNNIGTFLIQTVTLQYSYGWADFLRYYALFLFFAPVALWLLRQGLWYVVLILSAMVWCLFPFSPLPPELSQPISWQTIFFGGFIIGFYWPNILEKWRSFSVEFRRIVGLSFVSLFVLSAGTSVILVFGHEITGTLGTSLDSLHRIVEQYFNKDRLPLLRILLGIIWFWGLFWLVRRFEASIMRRVGWLFYALGSHSLYVYTIQAVIVFTVHLIIAPPGTGNVFLNLVVSLGAIGAVVIAVRTKFLMRIIPR